MNAHTNHQIINGPDGRPAFAVIPYDDFIENYPLADENAPIPNEVVGMVIKDDLTMVAAWRKHLGLTQHQIAERIGISQAAYAQQEAAVKPRRTTLEKIAAAMNIDVDQLMD